MNYSNIIVIGSSGRVNNIYVPDLSILESQENLSAYSQELYLGGTGFTIASSIKRLGKVNVSLISVVGNDGADILERAMESGIYGYCYQSDSQPTGSGVVVTELSGKQKWLYYNDYAAKELPYLDISAHVNDETFGILSPSNPGLFLKGQSELIRYNIPYMYDPGMLLNELSEMNLRDGIKNAKIVIANEYEWERITKRTGLGPNVLAGNGRIAIKTLAEKGVTIYSEQAEIHVVGFRSQLLDPTGAGDNWRAAFISEFANGNNLELSAEFANAFASISVEHKSAVDFPISSEIIYERMSGK